jgi:hypothetical protein
MTSLERLIRRVASKHADVSDTAFGQVPDRVKSMLEKTVSDVAAGFEDRQPSDDEYRQLGSLLLEWQFMEAKVEAGLAPSLIRDFDLVLSTLPRDSPARPLIDKIAVALRQNLSQYVNSPNALFPAMWNAGWPFSSPSPGEEQEPSIGATASGDEVSGESVAAWLEKWWSQKVS